MLGFRNPQYCVLSHWLAAAILVVVLPSLDALASGVSLVPGGGGNPQFHYPNIGVFNYGAETDSSLHDPTAGQSFTPLPYFATTSCSVVGAVCTADGTLTNYYYNANFSGPSIGQSNSLLTFPSSPPLVIPPDVVFMAPGSPQTSSPDVAVVRFNPDLYKGPGPYWVIGSFTDLQQSSVEVSISSVDPNGFSTPYFSASFSGDSPFQGSIPFALTVPVFPGGYIDFAVDSLGNQGNDVVGLQAVLNVPEPATWAMMLAGFACLGFGAMREKCRRSERTVI